jgi:hypothetical protein
MKKTVRRIASVLGLAWLFFGSPSAHAFCTEFEVLDVTVNCEDEGHKRITGYIRPILRGDIWGTVWNGNYAQDNPFGDFAGDGQRHFESCRFVPEPYIANNIPLVQPGSLDYIQKTYRDAISHLNPADPDPFRAADNFGKLLHTVQDFYSHTNWINLMGLAGGNSVSSADLFNSTLEPWPILDWLGPIRDDIILGQVGPNGLPLGWSVEQDLFSETPEFMTNEGVKRRGLITGWNESGACPDVREGEIVDEYSHVELGTDTGVVTQIPRTKRLVHGTSVVAGIYGGPLGVAYQADRPCHDDDPTGVCIQKDTPGRTDYGQALRLAQYQTAHEWCRLLNLTKDSQHGYAGASILMALWAKPEDEPFGPHPITTACGTPPEVLTGKPGPIEVTVDPQEVAAPSKSNQPLQQRHLVFSLYTSEFRRSNYRTATTDLDDSSVPMQPLTMCVKSADKLVATVWGWDDRPDFLVPYNPDFNNQDVVLRGTTHILDGPGFQPVQSDPGEKDLTANFLVTVGGADPDADGLSSACGEVYYGTDPQLADTDNDGLKDGEEVNTYHTDPLDNDSDDDGLNDGPEVITYGTDPLDADTDDDGLTDGDEVNTYHSDPLDNDSDDDGLKDGEEVNTYHTDPNDADTDDDRLTDGFEVKYGTDPLNSDTDGDGLIDGLDVEWIEAVIVAMPDAAIKSPAAGNRRAMLNLLNDAEALLRKGNRKPALDKLTTLRMRIDGCGAVCDSNDWIINCTFQTEIRMLVDVLIANVKT